MTCYHPIKAWEVFGEKTSKGKKLIVFTYNPKKDCHQITLPCAQCDGCRLERSRQWAVRCMHEASLYENNCFITLTFNDENLPANRSLDVKTYQDFMKRLRERFVPKCPYDKCDPLDDPDQYWLRKKWLEKHRIRLFYCGEYGEKYGRPHYHALLFNFDFPDKYYWRRTKEGHHVWRSPELERLWGMGNCEIGSVTFESAAYCARYIMDKLTVSKASPPDAVKRFLDKYEYYDTQTGEVFLRPQEFCHMSRDGGIGKNWIKKYMSDVYPGDFVVINNKKIRPPKFYDSQYEIAYPSDFDEVKYKRYLDGLKNQENNTPERLAIREQVQAARIANLKRNLH